jgi:dihydrofolate reductase
VSASVLYMSMSLDGYIAGPDDGPGNPGGDGFMRLHEWLATADGDSGRPPGPAGEMHDEMEATGAVLVGRRTAEQAGSYQGNHHGVPIVVVSRRPPPPSVASYPSVTYVTARIESAMTQAKTAAGDRDVMVHGAYTAQRALQAEDPGAGHSLKAPPSAGRREQSQVNRRNGYWHPGRAESFIFHGVFGEPARASLVPFACLSTVNGRRDDIAGTRVTGRSAHGIVKCLAGPVQRRLVPVAADELDSDR